MAVTEKTRWKDWADSLRQEMMTNLTAEVTKSIDAIISETETTKAASTIRSVRFWKACQAGKSPNDALLTAGFEIDFESEDDRSVREVTLSLNPTWMAILQPVLDRQKA